MVLIYIIIVVAFIDTFSQLPIISPFAISLGASPLIVGFIIGMYSFANMFGNILAGIWIDRVGSKKILSIGMLSVGVVLILYANVSEPYQLLVVRFLHGIAGGLIVPAAFTILGTKGKKRAKGKTMAFSGAGVGIAAIAGPALGAIISGRFGYEMLFYFISLLMLVFGGLAALCLKEKTFQSNMKENSKNVSFPNVKPILSAYLSIFLLLFTLGLLTYLLPLKVEALQGKTEITGMLMSVFGLVAILLFLLPSNRLFDFYDKNNLMKMGLFIISIALVILAVSVTIWQLFVGMFIYGVGFAFIFPSTSAKVIENSKPNERGRAFGIFYACFSLGVMFGSFTAGLLPFNIAFQLSTGAFIVVIVVIMSRSAYRFG